MVLMGSISRSNARKMEKTTAIDWLPIDSRILPDIVSFSHVRGIARVFLLLEIVLSVMVVLGTLAHLGMTVFTR